MTNDLVKLAEWLDFQAKDHRASPWANDPIIREHATWLDRCATSLRAPMQAEAPAVGANGVFPGIDHYMAAAVPTQDERKQGLTADQIARHTLLAKDCPPDSKVMPVSSIQRLAAQAPEEESTPGEIIADRLMDAWIAEHGKQIPWAKAIEILAVCTHMPEAERQRLLNLD